MKTIIQARATKIGEKSDSSFAVDTTFVLFFLAIEFGRSFSGIAFDSLFLALTLLVVAITPYFLANGEKIDFKSWIVGRLAITAFAVMLGWIFRQSLGIVFPEMFRFLPMTLLIVTAMLSCYIQFYSFFKLRFVK